MHNIESYNCLGWKGSLKVIWSPPLVRAERAQIKLLNREFPVQPCWPSATIAPLPKHWAVLCSVLDHSAFLGPFNFQDSCSCQADLEKAKVYSS